MIEFVDFSLLREDGCWVCLRGEVGGKGGEDAEIVKLGWLEVRECSGG